MLELSALALALVLEPLSVRWDAPERACASAAELDERLRARLGPRIDQARFEVEGTVTEHEAGLSLRLRIVADDVVLERELMAPVCEELVDATVLIASLALEERARGGASGSEPSSIPAPPDVPVVEEAPPPAVPAELDDAEGEAVAEVEPEMLEAEPLASTPPPWRAVARSSWVSAGAGATGGQLPGIGAVLTAGGGLGGRRWIARASLSYAPRRRALVPGFEDRGALIQAWYVSLDGGLRWPLGTRVRLPVSAGIDVGALHGRGFGVPTTTRRAQPWVAPALELGLEVRVGQRLWLWLAGRASAPLVRPAFAIEGRGTVFRAKEATIRLGGGLVLGFR